MFLEGYKRNWIHTEGYSFEDRMIDDLSVSITWKCPLFVLCPLLSLTLLLLLLLLLSLSLRKPWSRRKEKRKRRKRPSRIHFISSFCISVEPL